MNTIDKKAIVFKSLSFLCLCFLLQSFLAKSSDTSLFNTVLVKVEQEQNDIAVSVKTSKNYNKVEFYMFNVEGKLIKELSINGSRKVNITQLEKGIYTYDFFKFLLILQYHFAPAQLLPTRY